MNGNAHGKGDHKYLMFVLDVWGGKHSFNHYKITQWKVIRAHHAISEQDTMNFTICRVFCFMLFCERRRHCFKVHYWTLNSMNVASSYYRSKQHVQQPSYHTGK